MNDQPVPSSDLPVFAAAADPAAVRLTECDDPSGVLPRLTAAAELGGHLDAAMGGAAAPRVWLLVHEPGQTHLAAVAALALAEALAARDQAAFVLDADDRTTMLSRWFGRGETEGWIDLVRYGASVLTAGAALPFDGRTPYLLGVGSYAPTDVTAEEVTRLLTRLRRQADDVLVVVPVDLAGVWGDAADLRLLCVDRSQRGEKQVADLVGQLATVGAAPRALVTWGEPVAADEPPAAGAAPDAPTDDAPEAAPALTLDEGDGEAAGPAAEPAADDPAPETAPAAAAGAATTAFDEDPDAATGRKRPRGTSGVFWLLAVAAVVVIAAVLVYYLRFVRTDEPAPTRTPPLAAVTPEGPTGDAATGTVADTTDVTEPAPTDDAGSAADVPDAATDESAEPPAQQPATVRETEVEAADEAPARSDPEPAPARPVFDPAPYAVPVGADGWALHLFSFPDSAATAEQVADLDRRGLRAAVRVVVIPDKGRYHRIYVGSFPDRASARAAMPALFDELRIDWANPVRFGDGE